MHSRAPIPSSTDRASCARRACWRTAAPHPTTTPRATSLQGNANMDDTVRAPVLTKKILHEDLPVLLTVATDEIEYLQSRLSDEGTGALAQKLQAPLRARLNSLQRAREWLSGTVRSVETKRRTAV